MRAIIRIFFLICISITTTANARALPVPENLISWEIQNRFAPFEVLPEPDTVFEKYKFEANQPASSWLAKFKGVIRSPYSDVVFTPQKKCWPDEKSKADDLPWDQCTQRHSQKLLDFVRNDPENPPTVRIKVKLTGATKCEWEPQITTVPSQAACGSGETALVPLSGTTIKVWKNGGMSPYTIAPKHIVILGLGDSYASGEGNPDRPTEWNSNIRPHTVAERWSKRRDTYRPAAWIDDRCHRSFFNHQALVALREASDDPHKFVSFLHYGCTGAEIFDGVLTRQSDVEFSDVVVEHSQIAAAVRDLCPTGAAVTYRSGSEADIPPMIREKYSLSAFRSSTGDLNEIELAECTDQENFRSPDRVLLSIGGNDIGFSSLIQYFVAPVRYVLKTSDRLKFPSICPHPDHRYDLGLGKAGSPVDYSEIKDVTEYCERNDRNGDAHSGILIKGDSQRAGVAHKFKVLIDILTKHLRIGSKQIIQAQYPDPLRKVFNAPKNCSFTKGGELDPYYEPYFEGGGHLFNKNAPWVKLADVPPSIFNPHGWQFNLGYWESCLLLQQIDKFRDTLRRAAENRVTFINETRDAFVNRGWSKGTFLQWPTKHRPRYKRPAQWAAYKYEANGRAIRTPNDSILTQQTHYPPNFRGTGHPNLFGHALIAETFAGRLTVVPD